MGVRNSAVPDVWKDSAPIRADLFGTERLEHHAQSLAAAQPVASGGSPRVQPLNRRVKENADILLQAYRTCAEALQSGQVIAPAAEWLLDNFHLVEQQLRQIHDDLPPGYYRQLPKLAEGPFAGYPRVFGLTWAYVAHTDSLMSGPVLKRYVMAYQQVQPLMIGELWAVAITLRIVLIENMRRLAQQIVEGHALRLSGGCDRRRRLWARPRRRANRRSRSCSGPWNLMRQARCQRSSQPRSRSGCVALTLCRPRFSAGWRTA